MSAQSTAIALLLASSAISSQAANLVDQIQTNCSDAFSINGTSQLDWRCSGDLSITGLNGLQGLIEADQSISIWAAGVLSLHDVQLSAPNILLSAGTQLNVDASTQLIPSSSGQIKLVSGGGDLQLADGVSSVPEPSSRLMSLTALLLASACWLRRRPSH